MGGQAAKGGAKQAARRKHHVRRGVRPVANQDLERRQLEIDRLVRQP